MDEQGHAWTFLEQNMDTPCPLAVEGGHVIVLSMRSPAKETPNEDAAAVVPLGDRCTVLVVADGMGGSAAGERAASLAVHSLVESLRQNVVRENGLLRTAILNGIETANQKVCQLGIGAGTTMAVVEVRERTLRPYHVGDSLILLVGGRGKIKLQTVAHSPVGYAVEAGFLDEASALRHEDRHLVSNVVGSPDMRIEVGSPLEMRCRDTLLIASDGLSDNLHSDEIVDRIRKGKLLDSTRALAVQARDRMLSPTTGAPSKPDDLTMVVFRLDRSGEGRARSRGSRGASAK